MLCSFASSTTITNLLTDLLLRPLNWCANKSSRIGDRNIYPIYTRTDHYLVDALDAAFSNNLQIKQKVATQCPKGGDYIELVGDSGTVWGAVCIEPQSS